MSMNYDEMLQLTEAAEDVKRRRRLDAYVQAALTGLLANASVVATRDHGEIVEDAHDIACCAIALVDHEHGLSRKLPASG